MAEGYWTNMIGGEAVARRAVPYLEELARDGGDENYGICHLLWAAVRGPAGRVHNFVRMGATRWPLHSGDLIFPIPAPPEERNMSPGMAFHAYRLWDTDYAYGRMRRELCLFLAGLLKKELGI